MKKKIIKIINDNKLLIIFLMLLLLCFIFCSFNTFVINDDLPYSFFHRTSTRVTNIRQIILNQITDYKNINPRVFVHCVVQWLLIYNKTLWSILNPIMIVLTFLFMYKIIKMNTCGNDWRLAFLIIISLFLTLVKYKKIIYWVAGSVNYVWTGLLLLVIVFLYLKYGYSKKIYINILIVLGLSILHEYLLVFSIVFVFTNYLNEVIKKKKVINDKLIYFLPLIISSLFLFLSPSLIGRATLDNTWGELNIIEKIVKSIPVVSYNFLNYKTIVSLVYVMILMFGISNLKVKYSKLCFCLLLLVTVLAYISGNGWVYFLLAIFSFIVTIYYLYSIKKEKLILIFISMYGIVYSFVFISEYDNIRSNYIVYLFMIILLVIMLYNMNLNKRRLLYFFSLVFSILMFRELYSYMEIGNIYRERVKNINKCINDNCHVLWLKEIPAKYEFYHMDINSPHDDSYFAYKDYIEYYHLQNDITIEYYK